jgi:hypothetical protein
MAGFAGDFPYLSSSSSWSAAFLETVLVLFLQQWAIC